MSVEIYVTGLDEAIEWFDRTAENLKQEVQMALEELAQQIADYARMIAPVRTGGYQASIYGKAVGEWEIVIGSDYRVAAIIEYGSQPHFIRARDAEALHFFLDDGTEIFAKFVRHPGTLPNPVIHNAIMYFRQHIVQVVSDAVHQAKPT